MKTQLELAQSELNNRLDSYYDRNLDGGSSDEIFKIAFNIARQFNINVNDLDF